MLNVDHVAVIGSGFSGTLMAINLLRHGAVRVTLIEQRAERLGRGLAYGAAGADHILNVRAANMSALPDRPTHFVDWLKEQGLGHEGSFARRSDYGAYMSTLLDDMREAAGDRLTIVHDAAIDVSVAQDRAIVQLESGDTLPVDVAILAPGNLPPHHLPAFAGLSRPAYVADPWATNIADGLEPQDTVLIIGSGLTAVDCILSLDRGGFQGRIVAVSRRGLSPHAHEPAQPYVARSDRPDGSISSLTRTIRARAGQIGWRNAVDELRPFTTGLWRAASPDARARFLRHLRPYWDVHRHRIAPQVAARLDALRGEGRLEVRAAKVTEAKLEADGLTIALRPRGKDEVEYLRVARAINCTGPLGDLCQATDPLLCSLSNRGIIRPDPHNIGIDVDQQCRAVTAAGEPQDRLLIVGPITRGAYWEIVAVPDIRRQVWTLARQITAAHWVEAEGL